MTLFEASGKEVFPKRCAGNQHFLLFPQCFLLYQRQKLSFIFHLFCRLQMLSIWTRSNFCCQGMGHTIQKYVALSKQVLVFTCLHDKSFENTLGKGEIACKQASSHFSLSVFYLFSSNIKLLFANSF